MDWKTTTVTLAHPVERANNPTVREVKLREPDVDALEAIEELGMVEGKRPTIKQLRGMIVALGDQPTEVIGKLHKSDLEALAEAILPFVTGEEATPGA